MDQLEVFLWKISGYVIAVVAGLGAKMAVMAKSKNITWKDLAINSALAFAAAIVVYSILINLGYERAAIIFGVITGRFGDDVLMVVWKAAKTMLKNWVDSQPNGGPTS